MRDGILAQDNRFSSSSSLLPHGTMPSCIFSCLFSFTRVQSPYIASVQATTVQATTVQATIVPPPPRRARSAVCDEVVAAALNVPEVMTIYLKTPVSDYSIPVDVEASDTIAIVKDKIQHLRGIPTDRQLLIFDGEVLEDGRTLMYYNITNCAVMVLRWAVER